VYHPNDLSTAIYVLCFIFFAVFCATPHLLTFSRFTFSHLLLSRACLLALVLLLALAAHVAVARTLIALTPPAVERYALLSPSLAWGDLLACLSTVMCLVAGATTTSQHWVVATLLRIWLPLFGNYLGSRLHRTRNYLLFGQGQTSVYAVFNTLLLLTRTLASFLCGLVFAACSTAFGLRVMDCFVPAELLQNIANVHYSLLFILAWVLLYALQHAIRLLLRSHPKLQKACNTPALSRFTRLHATPYVLAVLIAKMIPVLVIVSICSAIYKSTCCIGSGTRGIVPLYQSCCSKLSTKTTSQRHFKPPRYGDRCLRSLLRSCQSVIRTFGSFLYRGVGFQYRGVVYLLRRPTNSRRRLFLRTHYGDRFLRSAMSPANIFTVVALLYRCVKINRRPSTASRRPVYLPKPRYGDHCLRCLLHTGKDMLLYFPGTFVAVSYLLVTSACAFVIVNGSNTPTRKQQKRPNMATTRLKIRKHRRRCRRLNIQAHSQRIRNIQHRFQLSQRKNVCITLLYLSGRVQKLKLSKFATAETVLEALKVLHGLSTSSFRLLHCNGTPIQAATLLPKKLRVVLRLHGGGPQEDTIKAFLSNPFHNMGWPSAADNLSNDDKLVFAKMWTRKKLENTSDKKDVSILRSALKLSKTGDDVLKIKMAQAALDAGSKAFENNCTRWNNIVQQFLDPDRVKSWEPPKAKSHALAALLKKATEEPSWFPCLSPGAQKRIIARALDAMSNDNLAEQCCAVCGIARFIHEHTHLHPTRALPTTSVPPNWSKHLAPSELARASIAHSKDTLAYPGHAALDGLVLDGAGISNAGVHVCNNCHSALCADRVPKDALALHDLWAATSSRKPRDSQGILPKLTWAERLLIAPYRTWMVVMKLRRTDEHNDTQQSAFRGHCITFPQDMQAVLALLNTTKPVTLPHSQDTLADFFSVTFLGDKPPTRAQLRPHAQIRRSAIRRWLAFLKIHHPAFQDANVVEILDEQKWDLPPEVDGHGEVPDSIWKAMDVRQDITSDHESVPLQHAPTTTSKQTDSEHSLPSVTAEVLQDVITTSGVVDANSMGIHYNNVRKSAVEKAVAKLKTTSKNSPKTARSEKTSPSDSEEKARIHPNIPGRMLLPTTHGAAPVPDYDNPK
jgi:hypothetical protein